VCVCVCVSVWFWQHGAPSVECFGFLLVFWSNQLLSPKIHRCWAGGMGHTNRQTSHMARCVTFAVARIRVGSRQNFAYFSLWHPKYGRQGSKKAYTGPTKFVCDRSIVVGCRSRNDRQTDRQTEWNDNKAHSLRTWRNSRTDVWTVGSQHRCAVP